MRLFAFFIIFIFYNSISHGQYIQLDNQNVLSNPCPYDSNQIILNYENWEVYQTLDGKYDGIRDSTICPSLDNDSGSVVFYGIDLNTIDIEKPIFIRLLDKSLITAALNPNRLYTLQYGTGSKNFEQFYDSNCEEDLCNGLFIQTQLTDPMYIDTLHKEALFPFTDYNDFAGSTCFVTEKTSNNKFHEVYYKFKFNGDINLDLNPILIGVYFEEHAGDYLLPEEVILSESNFDGTSYNLNIGNLHNYSPEALVKHHQPGLPTSSNPSSTILVPEIPKTQSTPINLTIEEYQNLEFQVNTELVGSLIEGNSDSLKHPVNIISNSLNWCLFSIELISDDRDLIFKRGGIHFSDSKACLQFRNNGKMIVAENHYLHLGDSGNGIINLRSGGAIVLEKNSTLYFDGTLILQEFDKYSGKEPLTMILEENSNLLFSPSSTLKQSPYGTPQKVHIFNLGGIIDLTNLSNEELDLIVIHEESPLNLAPSIKLFPNPANKYLTVEMANSSSFDLFIYTINGNEVSSFDGQEGNKIIDLRNYPEGLYIVKTISVDGESTGKFFVKH